MTLTPSLENLWQLSFPTQFTGLSPAESRKLANTIHSHVFEGFIPEAPVIAQAVDIIVAQRDTALDLDQLLMQSPGENSPLHTHPSHTLGRDNGTCLLSEDAELIAELLATAPDYARWLSYFYPDSNVLMNKWDIEDQRELEKRELAETFLRSQELAGVDLLGNATDGNSTDSPIETQKAFQTIHGYLFGAVYEWAGEIRDVDMAKGDSAFLTTAAIPGAFDAVDQRIGVHYPDNNATLMEKADFLGLVHAELNDIHPFREGNGRTTRVFMEQLAARYSFPICWSLFDREEWNQAAHASTVAPADMSERASLDGYFDIDPSPTQELYRKMAQHECHIG